MSKNKARSGPPKWARPRNESSAAAIERLSGNAVLHFRAGNLTEAETLCREILVVEPAHMTSLNILGASACLGRNLEEGVAWFRRAVAAKANDTNIYVSVGNALNELGKLDDAATAYRQAVELDPNSADAYNGLGTALRKQGHLAEALSLYRRAIGIRENYAEAYNGLGNAFLEDGKLAEAVQSYRQAIAINPDYADAEGNLGIVLQNLGKTDDTSPPYHLPLHLP